MADKINGRCAVRFLILGASLREGSFNNRLAQLAADVVQSKGGIPDVVSMREFDCPSYDYDIEATGTLPLGAQTERVEEHETAAA